MRGAWADLTGIIRALGNDAHVTRVHAVRRWARSVGYRVSKPAPDGEDEAPAVFVCGARTSEEAARVLVTEWRVAGRPLPARWRP